VLVVVLSRIVATWCRCLLLYMVRRCWVVDCSLEPVLWVSSVGDGTGGAIRIQNCVLALYYISITGLLVVLRVARQRILNAIWEWIVWFSLRKKAKGNIGSGKAKLHSRTEIGKINLRNEKAKVYVGKEIKRKVLKLERKRHIRSEKVKDISGIRKLKNRP